MIRQARNSEGKSIDPSIARDLSEVARQLQTESDPQEVMERIVRAAVDEINGATAAAITLLHRGEITSPAHTDELATYVGEAQRKTGEGPCVDTSREAITVRSDDLRHDERWPNFAPIAVEYGVLSMLSFQLFVESDSMGALDVYADRPHAFDDDAENTGLLLASHAAIAMSATRTISNLHHAVNTRDLIGQAKGILIERYKIDGGQAFDLLVKSSQATQRKLHDIADDLVATGELPLPPGARTHE
jgi:GAF domain-containing protein